jgi:hypothetical protein
MAQDQPPPKYSLGEILEIIERLRAELADDPDLSPDQRAAIEALLEYYTAITKLLEQHIEFTRKPSGTGAGP